MADELQNCIAELTALDQKYSQHKQEFEKWKSENSRQQGTESYNTYIAQFHTWEQGILRKKEDLIKKKTNLESVVAGPENVDSILDELLDQLTPVEFMLSLMQMNIANPPFMEEFVEIFTQIQKGVLPMAAAHGQFNPAVVPTSTLHAPPISFANYPPPASSSSFPSRSNWPVSQPVRPSSPLLEYQNPSKMPFRDFSQQCLIFPLYGRFSQNQPLFYFACAFILCSLSGYAQGAAHVGRFTTAKLTDPFSLFALAIFLLGATINIHSDYLLRNLRKPGEIEHKIPRGGMFEYVSGANFFGEIVEWFGYFLFTRTLAGFALFFFSASNLGPRAFHHHKDYLKKFPNYPKNRRALIPYLI
ncbi:hypothetical protein WR25_03543 [Diploscapter pachys]|uniref:3-oxo-5-alpha-steroid 4-dehydrogenase C-terminal domain-containing protein n=1 Tax=Diploscapter pachys TaxID=2018661 RepID=A0A2A2K4E5_9BILA|nr:hypothetical protein WR25_03543 [Diploscapter pachys]